MKPEKPLNVKKVISRFYKSDEEKKQLKIELDRLVIEKYDFEMNNSIQYLYLNIPKENYLEYLNKKISEYQSKYNNILNEYNKNLESFNLIKNIVSIKHYENNQIRQLKSEIQKTRNFLSEYEKEKIKLKNFLKECKTNKNASYEYDGFLLANNDEDIKKAKDMIDEFKKFIKDDIENLKELRKKLKQAYNQ